MGYKNESLISIYQQWINQCFETLSWVLLLHFTVAKKNSSQTRTTKNFNLFLDSQIECLTDACLMKWFLFTREFTVNARFQYEIYQLILDSTYRKARAMYERRHCKCTLYAIYAWLVCYPILCTRKVFIHYI